MERSDLDASQLVSQLRADLAARPWAPTPPPRSDLAPMTATPALGYLHRHWSLRRSAEPDHQPFLGGPKGVARGLVNRAAFGALRTYLDEEQELLANMVRLFDALARRCDAIVEAQAAELDTLRADVVELASRLAGESGGGG